MTEAAGQIARILHPRLRITCGADIALGPGKVKLLELVAQTGSIAKAARRMQMSYMRAWTLIKTMERCCRPRVPPGFYSHRIARRYRRYCNSRQPVAPRVGKGEGQGAADAMPEQPPPNRSGLHDVSGRLR